MRTFTQKVLEVVGKIPKGRTITYKETAKLAVIIEESKLKKNCWKKKIPGGI